MRRALIALCVVGCAARGGHPTHIGARLSAEERRLVNDGADDERMTVVVNTSTEGDAFLRRHAASVDVADPDLPRLLARMHATVVAEDGVGIAAPQIGVSRRVVIVQRLDQEPAQPYVPYLNPTIEWRSADTALAWEGCLSIPAGFGQVVRPLEIELTYDRADGTRARERISGFTARIFQHEIDHLDGVLFIDRKEPGELMPKDEYRAMREREKAAASQASQPTTQP
jgi:peptide deformylase